MWPLDDVPEGRAEGSGCTCADDDSKLDKPGFRYFFLKTLVGRRPVRTLAGVAFTVVLQSYMILRGAVI